MIALTLPHGSVKQVSFSINAGECLLLAGANGCGKTTLLKELAQKEKDCCFIPSGIPKIKGFTLEEFVRTACYRESNWAGKLDKKGEQRLRESLTLLGLAEVSQRDISTLSDGEFQKACIAAALTLNARLVLLDEPTAFLDVENRLMVLGCIREVAAKTGASVIFSSHDLHDSLWVANRVLAFLPQGEFIESGPNDKEEVLSLAFPILKK